MAKTFIATKVTYSDVKKKLKLLELNSSILWRSKHLPTGYIIPLRHPVNEDEDISDLEIYISTPIRVEDLEEYKNNLFHVNFSSESDEPYEIVSFDIFLEKCKELFPKQ